MFDMVKTTVDTTVNTTVDMVVAYFSSTGDDRSPEYSSIGQRHYWF